MRRSLGTLAHLAVAFVLTILTQLGGLAWLAALAFRRRVLAFLAIYAALSISALWIAPHFGRTAVPCFSDMPLRAQSPLYCALNRTYVARELLEVLNDAALAMDRKYPGTVTLLLDASFPFFRGFPLLPHLSHDDGRKADLAFYYRDATGYLPAATRSPIGYFAFEPGPTRCTSDWPSLRWDLAWLQSLWRDLDLDGERLRLLLVHLSGDPRVGRIFLEPHLAERLAVSDPKIRFQGCRAARHDDHIHLQL